MAIIDTLSRFFSIGQKAQEKSFFRSTVQTIGSKGAVYLDSYTPYRLYNEIPELAQVINKKADMFSNGIFKFQDIESGQIIPSNKLNSEQKALLSLLENPNVLQPQNKFLKTYIIQLDVYGNQFQYVNNPTSLIKVPSSITHISPTYLSPILTGKVYEQTDINGIIKNYEYKDGATIKTYETETIIWSKHDDLDNPVIGNSPLKSLRFPLTNTKLAYDYLNIISGEKGAIGMIATSNKDSMGAIPMSREDKIKLEQQHSSTYGVGDDKLARISIVDGTVSWQPMTYPTRDLLLMEQIDVNKLTMCDHFGMNINIFSSKNQTYENVSMALKQCYTDTVIPAADSLCQTYTKRFTTDKKSKLILDYSHIGILQPDAKAEADLLTTRVNALNQAIQGGIITPAQAQSVLANDFGFNIKSK